MNYTSVLSFSSYKLLLDKLRKDRFSPSAVRWFANFLFWRAKFVQIGSGKSTILAIVCGVFQGSLSGPVLFILYVNDMARILHILIRLLIYADETTIQFSLQLQGMKVENQAIFNFNFSFSLLLLSTKIMCDMK